MAGASGVSVSAGGPAAGYHTFVTIVRRGASGRLSLEFSGRLSSTNVNVRTPTAYGPGGRLRRLGAWRRLLRLVVVPGHATATRAMASSRAGIRRITRVTLRQREKSPPVHVPVNSGARASARGKIAAVGDLAADTAVQGGMDSSSRTCRRSGRSGGRVAATSHRSRSVPRRRTQHSNAPRPSAVTSCPSRLRAGADRDADVADEPPGGVGGGLHEPGRHRGDGGHRLVRHIRRRARPRPRGHARSRVPCRPPVHHRSAAAGRTADLPVLAEPRSQATRVVAEPGRASGGERRVPGLVPLHAGGDVRGSGGRRMSFSRSCSTP